MIMYYDRQVMKHVIQTIHLVATKNVLLVAATIHEAINATNAHYLKPFVATSRNDFDVIGLQSIMLKSLSIPIWALSNNS